ncbi:MAG: isoprenyl transferase [Myxococcota bacterium]
MLEPRRDRLPEHVAVIMDGNGRWAERRGLPRSAGHRAGVDAVRMLVRAAEEIGIRWLTLYAFSSENWNRPRAEVELLMKLPEEFFETELPEVIERNVRIQTIGREERLPPGVRRSLSRAVERTQSNTGMRLVFALSYGGRGELVEAARRMLRDHEAGRLDAESLDEKGFAAYLDEPELPDVDLLIRTGGERRISNFLLWQSAYAELVLSDVLWPDFGRAELERALADYAGRERRFGRTSAQVQGTRGR